jgi:hypothetical protein
LCACLLLALAPCLPLCSPGLLARQESSHTGSEEAEELTDLYHSRSGRHSGHRGHAPGPCVALLPITSAGGALLVSSSFSSHPCPAPAPSDAAPVPLRC